MHFGYRHRDCFFTKIGISHGGKCEDLCFWNVTTCMSGGILPKVGSIMMPSSLLSYNMTMEAAEYSETSTNFFKTTRLYMQGDKKSLNGTMLADPSGRAV